MNPEPTTEGNEIAQIQRTTINVSPPRQPEEQDVVYFYDRFGRKEFDLILEIDRSRSFIRGQRFGARLGDQKLHLHTAEITY